MTAEDIYIKAKKQMPSIAMGTVYRNLNVMAASGIIRRLAIPNAPDRFDKSADPHEHLICRDCGRLTDVYFPGLKDYLEKQADVEILGYDLSLIYICEDCKKEKAR